MPSVSQGPVLCIGLDDSWIVDSLTYPQLFISIQFRTAIRNGL